MFKGLFKWRIKLKNDLRLIIKDFECIKDADITFPTGTTLITGESGNGKSSLLRAIRYALLNPPIRNKIRKGSKKCVVTIEYNNNTITWERTKDNSKYTINGEVFSKVGNTNAIKLLENKSGFSLDTKNRLLNMEPFKEVLFPFGLSNSDLFKMMENFLPVPDSNKMIQIYKEEESSLTKSLSQENDNLQRCLNKLDVVNKITDNFNIEEFSKLKNSLELNYKVLNKKTSSAKKVSGVNNVLSILPSDIVNNLVDNSKDYIILNNKFNKISKELKFVQKVGKIPEIKYTVVLNIGRIIKLNQIVNKSKYVTLYDNIQNIPLLNYSIISKYNKLNQLVNRSKNIVVYDTLQNILPLDYNKTNLYNKLKDILSNKNKIELNLPHEVQITEDKNTSKFNTMFKSYNRLKKLYKDYKESKNIVIELQKNKDGLDELIDKFKKCPTCGSILDVE